MKYNVYAHVVGSKFLGTFEAETPEQAEQMALDNNGSVNICHHCAEEIEDAEIDSVTSEIEE